MSIFTQGDLEKALDSGKLQVKWQNGKWYSVRRNGKTKTWKREPSSFAIPCKTGFRDCFTITCRPNSFDLTSYLRIVE